MHLRDTFISVTELSTEKKIASFLLDEGIPSSTKNIQFFSYLL